MGKQGVKAAPVHGQKIHGGRAAGGGHPWAVAHEGDLAEALPGTESRQDFLDVPRPLLDHLHLPVDDDIETVAAVPLTEYDLLRLEMLPAEAWRLLRLELDDVGRKQQVQEPIRRYPQLAVEPGHLHQVDHAPQQPGEEARELDPEHLGDGRPVPESGELAERLERERPFGFAPQGRDEIPRQAPGLSDRVLSRRRTRLPGLAVENPRAVADRPYSRIVGNVQVLVDDQPSSLLPAGQSRDQGVGRSRHGTDQGLRRDSLSSLEEGGFARRARQTGVQPDLDTPAPEQSLRKSGEVIGQLGQDQRTGVEEDDPDCSWVDATEAARHPANEVVQLRHRLDAREPAAGDYEGEQRTAHLGVRFDVRFFEGVDDVIAQDEPVAEVLEGQRVLLKPRLTGKARDVAERDDEMIVLQLVRSRPKTRAGRHDLVLEIDGLHLSAVEVGVRTEPANRGNGIQDSDAPRDDLREHGLKHQIVLLADQPDFDAGIVLEKLFQRHRRVDAAEAASKDEHSRTPVVRHTPTQAIRSGPSGQKPGRRRTGSETPVHGFGARRTRTLTSSFVSGSFTVSAFASKFWYGSPSIHTASRHTLPGGRMSGDTRNTLLLNPPRFGRKYNSIGCFVMSRFVYVCARYASSNE